MLSIILDANSYIVYVMITEWVEQGLYSRRSAPSDCPRAGCSTWPPGANSATLASPGRQYEGFCCSLVGTVGCILHVPNNICVTVPFASPTTRLSSSRSSGHEPDARRHVRLCCVLPSTSMHVRMHRYATLYRIADIRILRLGTRRPDRESLPREVGLCVAVSTVSAVRQGHMVNTAQHWSS